MAGTEARPNRTEARPTGPGTGNSVGASHPVMLGRRLAALGVLMTSLIYLRAILLANS
jgi:hypothetical protein